MALWTPAEITTALWLDASDSSTITIDTGVSQWRDKSGNARHFAQATTTRQPALITAGKNGLDIIRFDGSSYSLLASISIPSGNWSAFFVIKPEVTSKAGGMYLLDTQSGRMIFAALKSAGSLVGCYFGSWLGTQAGTTAYQILEYYLDAGAGAGGSSILRNGTSLESITYTSNAIGGTTAIGSVYDLGTSFFNGDICEIILIPSAADLYTRQLMQGYAAWKWGVADDLPADHLYKSAAPTLHKVSGTVTVNGSPAARTVAVFRRSDFTLLGTTTSDASTGTFEILGMPLDANALLVTAIDSTGTYNAVSVDYITSVSS